MKKHHVALNEHFLKNKIAHQGLHGEGVSRNSLKAFQLAVKQGFAIELDVHLLTDGELAVVHDSDLFRLTGKRVIVETLSSKDLNRYPLSVDGAKIPTLKETLALVNGKVPLLIELKFGEKFDKNQADAVLAHLKEYPYKDKIALQSFHPGAVNYLKKHTDEYSVGLLVTYKISKNNFVSYCLRNLTCFGCIKADFIAYDIKYLPNKRVEKKRKKGYSLLAWTIDSQEKLEKAERLADNIIFEKINV